MVPTRTVGPLIPSTDLIYQEEQLVSVDGINGPTVRVGTMNDIDTGGNWPKLYDSPKQ